jgi:hypothetical protein
MQFPKDLMAAVKPVADVIVTVIVRTAEIGLEIFKSVSF